MNTEAPAMERQAAAALREAGATDSLAAAIVDTARTVPPSGVATKTDLAAMEARLTWRLVLIVGAASGFLFAALRMFPPGT